MDGVHSSSFKNIVQGESVGMRPRENNKDAFGKLVGLFLPDLSGLLALSTCCSLPAQFQRCEIHRELVIFSLGLWNILTFFFLFFFFCVNGYCLAWETKGIRG